jgi:hypothetical protein
MGVMLDGGGREVSIASSSIDSRDWSGRSPVLVSVSVMGERGKGMSFGLGDRSSAAASEQIESAEISRSLPLELDIGHIAAQCILA